MKAASKSDLYRKLPSVDDLVSSQELAGFVAAPCGAAGLAAAGLAAAEVRGLNRSPRLNLPGEDDGVGCVAGAGVALAFFIARCFAGVCDGEGDSAGLGACACEMQMPVNPITAMRAETFAIISARVRRRSCYSQSNSGDIRSARGAERDFSNGP